MIALDTCVLARLLVGDDPPQQELAARLVAENDCSVSWTVLVELCWVLERSLCLPREKVIDAFQTMAEIDRLNMPEVLRFTWCVERFAAGADFADVVHIASALPGSEEFATFDRKLVRQAGPRPPLPIKRIRS